MARLWVSIILLWSASALAQSREVCVLDLQVASHPYSKKVASIFEGIESVRLVPEASPDDFYSCIEDGFKEIIIIGHAGNLSVQNKAMLAFVNRDENNNPRVTPFLPRVFKQVREYLWKLEREGKPIALKRIRLLSCLSGSILNTYWDLKALIFEHNIQLDLAPQQAVMSLVKGIEAVDLDTAWLAESAQFENPQIAGDSFYIYTKLKTVGVVRYGSAAGLRGQYEVSVTGVALGLSQKWSTVYLRYDDVRDIEVGQVKSIGGLSLDASAAFWANIETGFFPKPYIQFPTEINSVGFAMGLYSKIKVRRLY